MPANIVVPEVGESIVDARVAKWLRKEGDLVAAGDPLVELETDKIDLEVGAPQAGVLSRIDRKDGEDVKVGEVLGVIDESEGGSRRAEAAPRRRRRRVKSRRRSRDAAPARTESSRQRATPTARKAAEQHDVDLAPVQGSGDAGRVMRRDVEKAASAPAAEARTPAPAAEPRPVAARPSAPVAEVPVQPGDRTEERVRMSKRRATIAKRLVEAQSTAAMLTHVQRSRHDRGDGAARTSQTGVQGEHGVGLGIASFFVKASIGALREFPRLNAEIQGDEMVLKHYYDIGVAVGASEGLVVPVLRDADRMSLCGDRAADPGFREARGGRHAVARRSQGRHVHHHERRRLRLAAQHADPEPAAGRHPRAAQDPGSAGRGRNGQVAVRPMMYVALTYDHRIVDGAEAVRFLVRVKELVEDPGALLLD